MKTLLTTIAMTLLISATAEAKTAAELIAKGTPEEKGAAVAGELAARNTGYRDLSGEVEMVLKDAGGSEARRRFSLKVLEQPDAKVGDWSLIEFQSPTDVKGTALLSHGKVDGDDDQWLYLPALGRVKRIASSNRTGAFVGSEFAYEDLTGNDPAKHAWRFLGNKPCGGAQCLELEATPKDGGSGYSKRLVLVDANEMRIASVDFFDRKGVRNKTLSYGGYRKVNDKFWRAQSWTMQNHQNGKTTVLSFVTMKMGVGLKASDFSADKLGH
ncbi:MAG: outer membrane lipoprotein-sorting protein [Polyangiaceae bacterium]